MRLGAEGVGASRIAFAVWRTGLSLRGQKGGRLVAEQRPLRSAITLLPEMNAPQVPGPMQASTDAAGHATANGSPAEVRAGRRLRVTGRRTQSVDVHVGLPSQLQGRRRTAFVDPPPSWARRAGGLLLLAAVTVARRPF